MAIAETKSKYLSAIHRNNDMIMNVRIMMSIMDKMKRITINLKT